VKSGDTADQVTVAVTNTSTTTEIANSAILTFTVPAQITVTGMTDSTGGWNCAVSTLSCTRKNSLGANVTDSVTLTLSVGTYSTLASYTGQVTATVSSVTFSSNVTAQDNVIFQQAPQIRWTTPAPIVYGTPLGAAQLDASSPVAGSFSYSPAAGTVLNVGQQTLTAVFTPTDTTDYITATASVILNVVPVSPTITLSTSANPVFMTYAVSFTASLPSYASTQTGTMTFYDGETLIGTAQVAGGSATLATAALAAGPHSITASYSGDNNYGPGTSGAVTENIEDFTLAFADGGSGTVSVQAGGQAVYRLVITPVGGARLPASVTLALLDVPAGTTHAFSPATVTAGSGPTPVTLEVTLPGNAAIAQRSRAMGGGAPMIALGLILLPFLGKLRGGGRRLGTLMALATLGTWLALGAVGCGGALSSENVSFTVTAASGSLSHSVTAQLVVK
jgi:hypothetical protein